METCVHPPEGPIFVQKPDAPPVVVPAPAANPDGFTGPIQPSHLSVGYRLGLVLVCVAMALLVAVYLGIIGFAAYGVYYHLANHSTMLGHTGNVTNLFVYLWPAAAGVVLVFFMIKPILAGAPEPPPKYSLTPQSDPVLFGFIRQICETVRAPLPSRVDVDCEINASASFRRGLLSMRGNDVVLTIGLPLAAGLTRQEFAGVLAHEFGHFAQGAGMRLTYLVRSINRWFARVVYERDEWDVHLVQLAYRLDIRFAIFLHLIRLAVWLTRRVLWMLMHLGNLISCFMLRQMEYDADSYETRLAGSEAFARTAVRLQQLNAAGIVAAKKLQESWNGRRLPENLPCFINACTRNTPAEVRGKIEEHTHKTRFLDTHPCDDDRVKAARALKQPGIYQNDQPASGLFNDFAGLCHGASRFHYEHNLQLHFTDSNLVSHEVAEHDSRTQGEGEQALKDFFLGLQLKYRPLRIPAELQTELFNRGLIESVTEARCLMEQSQPAVQKALSEYARAEQDYQRGLDAIRQNAQQATTLATQTMQSLVPTIAAFEGHCQVRLAGNLLLLTEPTAAAKLPNAAALKDEAVLLLPVFASLGEAFGPLQELRRNFSAFITALEAGSQEKRRSARLDQVQARLNELEPKLKELLQRVRLPLTDVPYPFHHARQDLTLDAFAKNDIPASHKLQSLVNDCNCHLDRLLPLYYRVLGRLAFIALSVEARVLH